MRDNIECDHEHTAVTNPSDRVDDIYHFNRARGEIGIYETQIYDANNAGEQ